MKRHLHTIPGFGTIKAFAATAMLCTMLTLAASLVGCTKELPITPEGDGNVEITFAAGGLQIDPAAQGDLLARHTRAGNQALIATDTAFRVLVYPKGVAVGYTPAAQNTYKIADNTGSVATTAVTAAGSIDPGSAAPGVMALPRETYDLYYFSPALPFAAGSVSNLRNGYDYMTVKHPALEVTPGSDGKFHVAAVQFARLCARLDVKISAKEDAFISSLGVGESGGEIAGLPATATYTLGNAALSPSGSGGTSLLKMENFEVTGTGGSTVLSTVDRDGAIVLPVSNRGGVTATVELLIDDVPVCMQVELPRVTFKAGYKYLLDLKVDRTGSPSFTLSAEPWIEGGGSDTEMEGKRGIGDLYGGGIVYWIDPDDAEHYKVVSLDEASSKIWSEADVWAVAYGQGWSLPTQSDLTDIYNARKNHGGADDLTKSWIDRGIATYRGRAFGTGAYWSATETTADGDDAQSVTLASGEATPQAKSTRLVVRAIRELPMPINLSAGGSANSYIASSAAKFYKFDARVKGNGKATLKVDDPDVWPDQRAKINPGDDLIIPKPLAPASAFVVWSTGPSLDAVIKDVKVRQGYVCFTATGLPGNALIGVKDADGTLIWSWHIWATDYDPATEDVPYTTRALVGNDRPYPGGIIRTSSRSFTMMGRNLGALNNTPGSLESIGLMYQWGRKDPFPSAATNPPPRESMPFESVYPTQNTDGYSWTAIRTFDEGVGSDADASIAYTIQHPTVYLECRSGSTASKDWLNINAYADQRDYLWGNPNPTDKIPNTLPGSKSIYDPCPPGYRVPWQDSWTSFSTDNVTVNGKYVNATTAAYSPGKGYTFYCHPTSKNYASYYPGTGRRMNDYARFDYNNPTQGYYWSSSSSYGGDNEGGVLIFSKEGQMHPFAVAGGERANGNFVRCAKE